MTLLQLFSSLSPLPLPHLYPSKCARVLTSPSLDPHSPGPHRPLSLPHHTFWKSSPHLLLSSLPLAPFPLSLGFCLHHPREAALAKVFMSSCCASYSFLGPHPVLHPCSMSCCCPLHHLETLSVLGFLTTLSPDFLPSSLLVIPCLNH